MIVVIDGYWPGNAGEQGPDSGSVRVIAIGTGPLLGSKLGNKVDSKKLFSIF